MTILPAPPRSGARPLDGKRIVVTRVAADAGALAGRLAALGAVPVVVPVIEIGPPPDPAAFDAALARAGGYDGVVFTSANGVRAAFERLGALGLGPDPFAGVRVACVGPATADALEARGVAASFVPTEYVAEALADELPDVAGRRLLLLQAEDARPVLAGRLRARGAIVEVVAAYTTRGAPHGDAARAALEAGADAVTFTAASTVARFLALPGAPALLARAAVACIGPVTADAARRHGLRVAVEADPHTLGGLVAGLVAYYA